MIRRLKHISARTKILLFAFLFIILPSAILGYLGFRSIGNRNLWLKENYRSMARLMREELESELSDLEARFIRDALDQDWSRDAASDRILLSGIRERHPAIGETYILDSEGSIIHTDFILDRETSHRDESMGRLMPRSNLIAQGERYEFSDLDYAAAARSYRDAVKQAPTPELRMYARLLLGRCTFKMKNYRQAGEQYRILAEQGREVRSSDGTPLRIIGLFRLAEIQTSLEEEASSIQTLLALFEELSLAPGGFESRDFYLESVRAELDRLLQERTPEDSDKDRWATLKIEHSARMNKIRRLEAVRPALLSRLDLDASPDDRQNGNPGRLTSAAPLTIRDPDGTAKRIGCLVLTSRADDSARRILAYELDRSYFLAELFPHQEGREIGGSSIRAGLLCEDGSPVSLPDAPSPGQTPAHGQPLAVEDLSSYLPGWSLALFDTQGKSIDQLVRGEMRLYGAILLGIALLIVSGIVLTLRAATHEAETVRLRAEFVSNISHELKTPLSLIRLFGETLESDSPTDPNKRREFSRIIARESRRLTHLIDNVLDFSKIDAGRKEYAFEKEDLVKVAADTLEAYRLYLRDQGFTYEISLLRGPITVSIDRDAMAQALLNLLNNAEKYSGEPKYIGVKMTRQEGSVSITVEDHGPGIPPSDCAHIFEKFYRGEHGPALEAQGCGLGLTIVKKTVESHGGTVSVDSEPGRGSKFTITLPLEEETGRPGVRSEEENG